MNNSERQKYEKYTEELIYDKFNIRNIYDAICGIKPKTPSGALRIFLQEKAINNEINNIGEGIFLWNTLSIDEKEVYLNKCHIQFLAYKYKELIYNKKIKRILPKRPPTAFNLFIKNLNKYEIPKDKTNNLKYYHKLYNAQTPELKEELDKLYEKNKNEYYKQIEQYKNKTFDLPERPKSPFSFYVSKRFDELFKEKRNKCR